MPALTAREKRLLRRTGDWVRMYLAVLTFAAPFLAGGMANASYGKRADVGVPPDIPREATYGTITGIYLPIFAAVVAYVWATRAFPSRNPAPHGFAMALFRDAFTVLVASVVLLLPVVLYAQDDVVRTVNTYMVWYQTIVTAVAGGAFTYYFHGSIDPTAARAAPEEEPRRPGRARAAVPPVA